MFHKPPDHPVFRPGGHRPRWPRPLLNVRTVCWNRGVSHRFQPLYKKARELKPGIRVLNIRIRWRKRRPAQVQRVTEVPGPPFTPITIGPKFSRPPVIALRRTHGVVFQRDAGAQLHGVGAEQSEIRTPDCPSSGTGRVAARPLLSVNDTHLNNNQRTFCKHRSVEGVSGGCKGNAESSIGDIRIEICAACSACYLHSGAMTAAWPCCVRASP